MKKMIKKTKPLLISLFIIGFLFLTPNTGFFRNTFAQSAINLSITPPLLEVTIKPGKEVRQTYTLMNNGGDTTITPRIVYLESGNDNGSVNLTEDVGPEWVRFDEKPFEFKNQDIKQFNIVISPPEDTEEIDHFLTLVFETTEPSDILFQNSTFYKSQIGTNILITVSKDGNPKKSAEILEFKGPKIIDSIFGEIKYNIKLKNNGNSFWKPIGKIIINESKTLKIAPLNIISGTSRNISCLNDEELVDCKTDDDFLFGKYQSKLEFSVDDDPRIYKAEITTIALPFSIVFGLLGLLTLYRLKSIVKAWTKKV